MISRQCAMGVNNMKYNINSKMLSDALTRCVSVSDGYVLTFTNRPVKTSESNVYATISACSSSASSNITVIVTKASSDATEKKVSVGTEFFSAVKALCKVDDIMTIDLQDNSLELSCGGSSIPVAYKEKVKSLSIKSLKHNPNAKFVIETMEWKRVIQQVGFACGAYDETGDKAGFNNILLLPCMVEEEYGIRTCSSDGYYASSSYSTIKEPNETFVEMVNSSKHISIPPSTVKAFSAVLKSDTVTVFIFDTQLMIRDKDDIFVLVLAAAPFPVQILALIDNQSYNYSLKATISDLKIALDIVSVNCSDTNKAAMFLEINEGVIFYSRENANTASVKAECTEGTIKISLCIKRLKDIITSGITEVNSVVISGAGNASTVHVRGGHCSAFTLPITSVEPEK